MALSPHADKDIRERMLKNQIPEYESPVLKEPSHHLETQDIEQQQDELERLAQDEKKQMVLKTAADSSKTNKLKE